MYLSHWVDRVGVVIWKTTEVADALALRLEMESRHARAGAPLVLIMVFPEGHSFPSPHVRRALKEHGTVSLKLCSSIFSVIEGNGLGAGLFRTANRALLTVMGLAKVVQTCGSIEEALDDLPLAVRHLRGDIKRGLEKDGVILAQPALQP